MKNWRNSLLVLMLVLGPWGLGCSDNAAARRDAAAEDQVPGSHAAEPLAGPSEVVPYAPYDESADAAANVEAALARAGATGKLVLLNFGANWCPDCRALAHAMEDPELAGIIRDGFVVVRIDVGNWDRNPDVVDEWGNPIAEGIPAIVVAEPGGQILFATRRGQISSARNMGSEQFAAFFRMLAGLGKAG